MQVNIVHSVPGRLRLRLPGLPKHAAALWRSLAHWVAGQSHVCDQRVNAACACIIIHYDSSVPESIADVVERLQTLSIAHLSAILVPESCKEPKPPSAVSKLLTVGATLFRVDETRVFQWSTASLLLTITPLPFIAAMSLPLLFLTALPIWHRAFTVLRNERRLNVDLLDSLAILVTFARAQWFTGAFMILMISLGDFIRNKTAAKSKRAIRDLLEFETTLAWVFTDGQLRRIPAGKVTVGETVVVHPGEMIPVDGEVLRGEAAVDQKIVTGESLPIERRIGDVVYASTVVREG